MSSLLYTLAWLLDDEVNAVRRGRIGRRLANRPSAGRSSAASGSNAEGRTTLLDGADPFLRIQLEIAVGDHAGGLLERGLGLLDQVRGSAGCSAHLRATRVKGSRILVGEAIASADELLLTWEEHIWQELGRGSHHDEDDEPRHWHAP